MAASYRDMNEKQKNRHSLAAKTVRMMVLSGVILGIVALVIGLGIYSESLVDQYTRHAFDIANYALLSMNQGNADPVALSEKVMKIYTGLSDEERSRTGTDQYVSYFSEIDDGPGSDFRSINEMLGQFISYGEVRDVYLAMFDRGRNTLVYIVDPEKENHFRPGEWEAVSGAEVNKFFKWDGKGLLYDIGNDSKYGWMSTSGVPLRNQRGEIVAFVLTDVTVDNLFRDMTEYALKIALALLASVAITIFFVNRSIRRRMVKPINQIAGVAGTYFADKGSDAVGHFASLNIQTGDELENLSLVLKDMERELTAHEEEIRKITSEKEREGAELQMAYRIQQSMLPHIFPPFPDRKEFDLYATMDPAREVGGDFYDFFLIDHDHLGMVMADVSGKGVPAALFMMISKVILQSCAMLGRSAEETLVKMNEALSSNNQVEMFVTVWFGILQISTGKIEAANAGHEYPIVYRRNSNRYEVLHDKHGFVIGGLPSAKYKGYEIQMNPGDKLFLYTDGLPEATDEKKQMFGMERIIRTLNYDPSADVEKTLVNIREAVDNFVREAEQFDDLTMMSVEYHGVPGKKTASET